MESISPPKKHISSNQKNPKHHGCKIPPRSSIHIDELLPILHGKGVFHGRAKLYAWWTSSKVSPSIKLKLSTRSTWQQALLKICENLWKRLEIKPNIWLLNMPCSTSRLCAGLLSEKNWSRMSVMYVIKNVSSGLSSSNLSCQPVVVG